MFQKKFSVDNLKMTGLYGYVYDFTVDYESIDVAETFYICKYLMQKTWHKIMFGFIKKVFIGLLSVCTTRFCDRTYNSKGAIKDMTFIINYFKLDQHFWI